MKVLFKINVVSIVIITALISNIYIRYINNKYNHFYNICQKEITFNAIIISEAIEKEYNYVYTIKGIDGIYKNKKFLVYINKDNNYLVKYGDLINLRGTFKEPSSSRNYKGFSYKEYLKTNKIYGTIKISDIAVLANDKVNIIFRISNSIKETIKNNTKKILPKETGNLLIGLILGDKSDLSEDIEENFKDSNLSHMLAVSGSHVTYIVLGLTYILDKIKIQKRKITIITITFLIFFMFITGFTPSVVRACVMGILVLGSNLFYRKTDFTTSISLSLLIILIQNPFSINSIGLQLSYLGAIGIICFNKEVSNLLLKIRINKKIANLFSITISAQLLIMPIMILKFNTLSTTFLISNVLATLPFGGSIILGFITIIFSFISITVARILSLILNIFLKLFIFISKMVSEIPYSNLILTTPRITTIIIYYVVLISIKYLLSIYTKTKPKRKIEANTLNFIKTKRFKKIIIVIFLILILTNIFPKIKKLVNGELDIYFIDVGQGDSTLVSSPHNKTILIDGGDGLTEILLPYLLDRKIKVIDFLIISHFDSDHCNGLIPVLEELKINNLYISKQIEITEEYTNIIELAKRKNIKINVVKEGDRINIESNIYIDILYPTNNLKYKDLNNNSIVCKLKYNAFSMLFTGDIQASEKDVLNKYSNTEVLKADIIKISHHGSNTSSQKDFLQVIKPKIALIGVGESNKFGHPSQEVLNRLEECKIKIYRTDLLGEIYIKINKKGKIMQLNNSCKK